MTYKTLIDHYESLCEKEGKSVFVVKYINSHFQLIY